MCERSAQPEMEVEAPAKLEMEIEAREAPAKPEVHMLSGPASLPLETGALCDPVQQPPAKLLVPRPTSSPAPLDTWVAT